MRVLLWILLVVSGLAALAAWLVGDYGTTTGGDFRAQVARAALLVMTGAALGLAAGLRQHIVRGADPDADYKISTPSPMLEAPAPSQDALADTGDERVTLAFATQLLAATSADAFQLTIERDLPHLLGGRKVWIAWQQSLHPLTPPDPSGEPSRNPMLTEDVQGWTTFHIKMGDQRVALLGVASAGEIPPAIKQRVQTVSPMIAQALQSVQAVDLFREASVVDLLTGAATRREGLNRLQAEAKRAQRTHSPMAVLMIDLDHFKTVNDRFGHAVGDSLLTAIGETMLRTLRASDIRCRWGGEEFLVILPETTLAQAQVVATYLLQNIAEAVVPSAAGPVSSTASIGLTISGLGETDVSRIVARADMALYRAKNSGRSCIRVVLGEFDGQPIGAAVGPVPAPETGERPDGTLPFPDRRNPAQQDRRRVPGAGRAPH